MLDEGHSAACLLGLGLSKDNWTPLYRGLSAALKVVKTVFYWVRIHIKYGTMKYMHIPMQSYCKRCGRKVSDFNVSDDIWRKVSLHIKYGNVLCYDCFCIICREKTNLRQIEVRTC